jgi:hypothetical protein
MKFFTLGMFPQSQFIGLLEYRDYTGNLLPKAACIKRRHKKRPVPAPKRSRDAV